MATFAFGIERHRRRGGCLPNTACPLLASCPTVIMCAYFALWLSSQASSWLPEGEGMLVFKSIPEGRPELKPLKSDTRWNRAEVESTVGAWLRYIAKAVTPGEAARVKQAWADRFAALPPDGDVSKLPASQKLDWIDLPISAAIRGGAQQEAPAVQTGSSSSVLENPDVNPVTGHGRTAAEVQRELATHQAKVREQSKTAIFQADYIFVKGATGDMGKRTRVCGQGAVCDGGSGSGCTLCDDMGAELVHAGVELHRVAHGLCLGDALAPDISFTSAELQHHPQEGISGFWGYFTPKPNPNYDPKNRQSGTKLARHHNMSREDILVYDVQVPA